MAAAAQRAEQHREILGRSRRRGGGDLGHGWGPAAADGRGNSRAHTRPHHKGAAELQKLTFGGWTTY